MSTTLFWIIFCTLSGIQKRLRGIWVEEIWKQNKKGKRERGRGEKEKEEEEEERELHRCQGFPVQCTETRANTTIRMSREIVK